MKNITQTDNSIEAEEADYLYVETSQIPNAGQGLYTAIKIYKNEVITVFEGELLTSKQAKDREEAGLDRYFIKLLNGKILDSMNTPCFAKYANDAKGSKNNGFKNNSIITLDDSNNVIIKAKKIIKAGDEIFCGYGKKYWKKHR